MIENKFVVDSLSLSAPSRNSPTEDDQVCDRLPVVPGDMREEDSDDAYLEPASPSMKEAIIRQWQDHFSRGNLEMGTCAVCAVRESVSALRLTEPNEIDLRLLRNDELPLEVRPLSYNFEGYRRAILHPRGLTDVTCQARMWICRVCVLDLKEGLMPRLSLANWLYYGREALPSDVQLAFREVSVFEKAMLCRARTNSICCRFSNPASEASFGDQGSRGGTFVNTKRGMKGNVIVSPLDTMRLNEYLPPSVDVIRDTLCVLFVGKGKLLGRANIEKFHPVLVRKSRVKLLIEFLLQNNPHYARVEGFRGFSEEYLNGLFQGSSDSGLPAAVDVAWVNDDDAIEGVISSYAPDPSVVIPSSRSDPQDELLMENVGYTMHDQTPLAYRDMKLNAVQRCLAGKPFIRIQKGDCLIPDFNNPYLLSWVLPHLDPWGIGGFYHPKRKRYVSMEEQLAHMLRMDDDSFQQDSEFAFLFYNIIRKKNVTVGLRFSAPAGRYRRVVSDLLSIDQVRLVHLAEKLRGIPLYRPENEEDCRILGVLRTINLLAREIPGGAAQKLRMRNEIRGMMISLGAPSLFITLNPSDKDNPLVQIYACSGPSTDSILRGEALTEWERRVLASKKPGACAVFFDSVVRAFIKFVLRFNEEGAGLYGRCEGYYGTVEAQGRGTLHCHMLIWLRGHPSPRKLRLMLLKSPAHREKLKVWLESIMHGNFLGEDNERLVEQAWSKRMERELTGCGSVHPGAVEGPVLNEMLCHDFWIDFGHYTNQLLVEYNMHEHTATCWKYLARGEPKAPQNCRVGITGEIQPETVFHPESMRITVKKTHPKMTYFTPLVTFLMKCNTDIKFVGAGSDANAFLYYLTDYITKSSMSLHVGLSALAYAIRRIEHEYRDRGKSVPENDTLRAFTIAVNSMVGHQEISHQQVMSYVLGGGDHYTSGTFHSFNWGEVMRYVQGYWTPSQEGADEGNITLTLGDGDVSISNQRLDYMFRPENNLFSTLCMYDFFSFAKKKKSSRGSRRQSKVCKEYQFSSPDHPQSATHVLTIRKAAVIPVLLGPSFSSVSVNDEVSESWAMRMLILFKPWRKPEDLKRAHDAWVDAYNELLPTLPKRHRRLVENIQTLAESKEDRDRHSNHRNQQRDSQRGNTAFRASELMGDGDFGDLEDDRESGREVDACVYGTLDGGKDESLLYSPGSVARVQMLLGGLTAKEFNECYTAVNEHGFDEVGPSRVGVAEANEEDVETIEHQLKFLADKKYDHIAAASNGSGVQGRDTTIEQTVPEVTPPSVSMHSLCSEEELKTLRVEVDEDLEVAEGRSDWALVTKIAIEKGFQNNLEQLRAFLLIARHIVFGGDQLLMYISGMGGSGKSYIVQAIVLLLKRLNRRGELLIGAPTGIAAVLIEGATLHSLIMASASKTSGVSQKLIDLWCGVRYLVVDEISMVGAAFLALMSSRIRIAKGDDALNGTRLFGGVSVICLGDFCQLKPPQQLSLYCDALVSRPSFEQVRNNHSLSALTGAYLWRQFTTVVCLQRNQRQKDDPTFADVLKNIRLKTWKAPIQRRQWTDQAYIDYLRSRLISSVIKTDSSDLLLFADAPVVVGHKVLRDALNTKLIQYHSHRLKEPVFLYHARDTISHRPVPSRMQQVLWALPSNKCGEMLGKLPLFIGMKVMITENLSINDGIVNGAEGTVCGVKYHIDEDGRRYADAVYVKVVGCGIKVPGLEKDVVVLGPVASSVSFNFQAYTSRLSVKSFRRRQIPILPAYSYTDYKSQGRSLERCIVDLATARGQGVYVMLSRVKRLEGLLILRWFSSSQIFQRFPEELRNEIKRIDGLDRETEIGFNEAFKVKLGPK